ncbi:MAG: Foldase protein PrsA 3 [Syntrophomonadaceae bacterium]|nr:Foldase protein PrsA 3 [Bacillota bacterium]
MTSKVRSIKWSAGAFLLLLLAATAAVTFLGASNSQVVATVNGEKVTRAQLDKRLNILLLFEPDIDKILADETRRSEFEKQVLETLVDGLLLKSAVGELGLRVSAEEIDDAYQYAMAELKGTHGTEQAVAQKIKKLGVAERDLRNFLNYNIYSRVLYSYHLLQVTDEKARAFVRDRPSLTQVPAMLDISHILVETKETAWLAQRRLLAGERFATLAVQLSKAYNVNTSQGRLGQVPVNMEQFSPAFMETARALPVGMFSAPVESPLGWHIIKVHGRTEAKEKTYEEIRDVIFPMVAEVGYYTHLIRLHEQADISYKLR